MNAKQTVISLSAGLMLTWGGEGAV